MNYGPSFRPIGPEATTNGSISEKNREWLKKAQGAFAFSSSGVIFACCDSQVIMISPSFLGRVFAGVKSATSLLEGHRLKTASFPHPGGLLVINHPKADWKHTIMLTETSNHVIIRIKNDFAKIYAGTGQDGHTDGPRRLASFALPELISQSHDGRLFIASKYDNRIRLLNIDSMVSTIRTKEPVNDIASFGLSRPNSVLYLGSSTPYIAEIDYLCGNELSTPVRWLLGSRENKIEVFPRSSAALAYSPSAGVSTHASEFGIISVGENDSTVHYRGSRGLLASIRRAAFAPNGRLWYSLESGIHAAPIESAPIQPIIIHQSFADSTFSALHPLPSRTSTSNLLEDINRDIVRLIAPGCLENNFSDCLQSLPSSALVRFLSTIQGMDDAFEHLRSLELQFEAAKLDDFVEATLLLKPLFLAQFCHISGESYPTKPTASHISTLRAQDPNIELSIYHSYLMLLLSVIRNMSLVDQVKALLYLQPSPDTKSAESLREIERNVLSLELLYSLSASITISNTTAAAKEALETAGRIEYVQKEIASHIARLQFKRPGESSTPAELLHAYLSTCSKLTYPSRLLKKSLQTLWGSIRSPTDYRSLLQSFSGDKYDEMPSWDFPPLPEPNFELNLLEGDFDPPQATVRELKVHDWLLHARWPFFRAMISSGLVESRERQLSLPSDFPLEVFIAYLYSSKCPSAMSDVHARFIVERGVEYGWASFETDEPLPDFKKLFVMAQNIIHPPSTILNGS